MKILLQLGAFEEGSGRSVAEGEERDGGGMEGEREVVVLRTVKDVSEMKRA